jgi:hypothetical protein
LVVLLWGAMKDDRGNFDSLEEIHRQKRLHMHPRALLAPGLKAKFRITSCIQNAIPD